MLGALGMEDMYNIGLKTDSLGKLKQAKTPLFIILIIIIMSRGITSSNIQKFKNDDS